MKRAPISLLGSAVTEMALSACVRAEERERSVIRALCESDGPISTIRKRARDFVGETETEKRFSCPIDF